MSQGPLHESHYNEVLKHNVQNPFHQSLDKNHSNTYKKMSLPVNWMEVNGGFDGWVCCQKMVEVEDKEVVFRFGQCVVHKYEINLKQKWKRNLQALYLQQRIFLGGCDSLNEIENKLHMAAVFFCIVQMTCELISTDVEQCIMYVQLSMQFLCAL